MPLRVISKGRGKRHSIIAGIWYLFVIMRRRFAYANHHLLFPTRAASDLAEIENQGPFLDAATHLYRRVCPSVRPSHVCKDRQKGGQLLIVILPLPNDLLVVYPALFLFWFGLGYFFSGCHSMPRSV